MIPFTESGPARANPHPVRDGGTTSDPDIFLRVNGSIVRPHSVADAVYTFRLTEPARTVHITSRSVIQAAWDPQCRDRRRLGVNVSRIELHGKHARTVVRHDDPLLEDGFHRNERTHRWTNGYARLPSQLLGCVDGPIEIRLHLASRGLRYHRGIAPMEPRVRPLGPRRALFVDAKIPTPDQDAGSTVICEQMRVLRSLGFKATFLAVNEPDVVPRYSSALQDEGVEVIHGAEYSTIDEFIGARGGEFDLAYLHRFDIAERCIALLRFYAPHAPIIFNNADLHYLRAQRSAALSSNTDALAASNAIKVRELAVIRAVDCTLICNLVEQDILRHEVPEAFCYYLPWVIETPESMGPPFQSRRDVMFLGGFNHSPNLDGVQWFVSEILPVLRRMLPGVRLHIYGSAIPESLLRLSSEDVVIDGHVADLRTAFDRHRVSVVPLRYGAGFKGKLAASLAYGIPVVASPIGAEGTGVMDSHHLLVAAEPESFAAAVARLYTSEPLWNRIRSCGRQFTAELFSHDKAREHFRVVMNGLRRPDLVSQARDGVG